LGSKEGAFYCGKSAFAAGHYKEALDWFHRAAAQEYGPALLWLGLAHARGLGVNIDLERGTKYLERAAATGNFPARRELAVLMIKGKLGVPKILMGLVLFPYAVIAAIVSGISEGHSHKLMG
jgi:TPR repeat protein